MIPVFLQFMLAGLGMITVVFLLLAPWLMAPFPYEQDLLVTLARILFPIVLVPKLGLVRTSLAFGLLNAVVGLCSTWLQAPLLARVVRIQASGSIVSLIQVASPVSASSLYCI